MADHDLTSGLEAVEDAIIDALATDATIASYARHVGTWQGKLEDALEQSLFRDPSILVLFGGFDTEHRGGDYALQTEWQVLVRDRNLRRERARRTEGPAGEPGTYKMVADVIRVLTRAELAVDGMDELHLVACRLLQTGRDPSRTTSAYLLVFAADLDLLAVAPEQTLDELAAAVEVANLDEDSGETEWNPVIDVTVNLEP